MEVATLHVPGESPMKSPARTVPPTLIRLNRLLIGLALFPLLLVGREASATSLYLSGFTSPVTPGSSVTIGVYADSYTDLYAWQFDFSWNPSVLSLVSISEGNALQPAGATYFVPGTIDNVAGAATANADTLLGAGPGANGSAESLADFTFTAISSGVSPLTIGGVILLDSNLNLIDVNTVPSTIDVTNVPSPVPEPGSFLLLGTGLLLLTTYKLCKVRGESFVRGKRMTLSKWFAVVVVFAIIAPLSAQSTVVQGVVTGVIRPLPSAPPVDYFGLFGPVGASLDGLPISVFYSYATLTPPQFTTGSLNYQGPCLANVEICTIYGIPRDQPNVIAVTVNGITVTSATPRFYGYDYDTVEFQHFLDPTFGDIFYEWAGDVPFIMLEAGASTLSYGVPISPSPKENGGSVSLTNFPGNFNTYFNIAFLIIPCTTSCTPPAPITPVSITTTTLPGAFPAATYSLSLLATGGAPPYTWSVAQGTLPAGFTLDPSSGTLVGSGRNERSNLYSFTAMVTDSKQQTAQQPLSLLVNCSASDTTDTDGDGLPDCWESYGVYTNGRAIDLPSMGANPNHKDIFVYYDWLDDLDDPNPSLRHTHDPASLLDPVVESFSNSPVDLTNPAGSGVTLHLVRGHAVDERATNEDGTFLTTSGADCSALNWTPFYNVMSADSQGKEFAVFHYALFAHNLAANCPRTGVASFPTTGQSLIVSLGYPSSRLPSIRASATAGTFMHELGHNLGLHHGGIISGFLGNSPDDLIYKPNYLSVMNYWFQTGGLVKTVNGNLDTSIADIIDYSRPSFETGVLSLDEQHLDEPLGIGPGAGVVASGTVYGTIWSCNNTGSIDETLDASKLIDWNCNGYQMDYNVAQVLRSNVQNPTDYHLLSAPESDWQNLVYKGGAIGALGVPVNPFQIAADYEQPTELSQSDALYLEQHMPLRRCGADLNNDGVVDQKDLDFVKAHFGTHYGDSNYDVRADYNGDGSIDTNDLAAVAQAQGCRSSFAVTGSPTAGSPTASNALWVTDRDGSGRVRVEKFDKTGAYLSEFTIGGGGRFPNGVAGIAIAPTGEFLLTDVGNKNVSVFTSDGTFEKSFGSYGSGNGQFLNGIGGISVDSAGNSWVVDAGNNRVQEFDSNGAYVGQFGTTGDGNGQFRGPRGIIQDSAGNIFVTDGDGSGRVRVEKFDKTGAYLSQFTIGDGGRFPNGVAGIAISPTTGEFLITDVGKKNVSVFANDGTFERSFGSYGSGNGQFLNGIGGISVDSTGNSWVVDAGNNRVQEFDSNGAYVGQFGTTGDGNGQFHSPRGIVIH